MNNNISSDQQNNTDNTTLTTNNNAKGYRVFIGAYNDEGLSNAAWVDATQAQDEFIKAVEGVAPDATTWKIEEFEDGFSACSQEKLNECIDSPLKINLIAQTIETTNRPNLLITPTIASKMTVFHCPSYKAIEKTKVVAKFATFDASHAWYVLGGETLANGDKQLFGLQIVFGCDGPVWMNTSYFLESTLLDIGSIITCDAAYSQADWLKALEQLKLRDMWLCYSKDENTISLYESPFDAGYH